MKNYALIGSILSFITGLILLHQDWNTRIPTLDAGAALEIIGGAPTCNFGAALDGNMSCLGACANNMTYSSVGANGTTVTVVSCGTCGGSYKGTAICPDPNDP